MAISPSNPEYGEYPYLIPYKEGDIRAPSDMISSGDWLRILILEQHFM